MDHKSGGKLQTQLLYFHQTLTIEQSLRAIITSFPKISTYSLFTNLYKICVTTFTNRYEL